MICRYVFRFICIGMIDNYSKSYSMKPGLKNPLCTDQAFEGLSFLGFKYVTDVRLCLRRILIMIDEETFFCELAHLSFSECKEKL